jgi:hypothetical protein
MVEIDAELVERVTRWCAEAGRQTGRAEIHTALAPLSWDELLALRALLADPPPARPLGPHALADLARGAPADVAAEREREGRYAREAGASAASSAGEAEPAAPARPRRAKGRPAPAEIVIHRARDRVVGPSAAPAPLPTTDALRAPEGRAVLERLVRSHGARRPAILAELAAGWRRPDGAPPGDADLAALLDHHGLSRAFERRERDELLHEVRAAGGLHTRAAERLGCDRAGLAAAIERLRLAGEVERIRDERRADLRARATLSERVHLLVDDEDRLRDLDLLAEFEHDLRGRLPEHVRALRLAGAPLEPALARSLAIDLRAAGALARRFELDLGPAPGPRAPEPPSRPRRDGAHAPGRRPRSGEGRRPGTRRDEGRGRGEPRAERPRSGEGRQPGTRRDESRGRGEPRAERPRSGEGRRPGTRRDEGRSRGEQRAERPRSGEGRRPGTRRDEGRSRGEPRAERPRAGDRRPPAAGRGGARNVKPGAARPGAKRPRPAPRKPRG